MCACIDVSFEFASHKTLRHREREREMSINKWLNVDENRNADDAWCAQYLLVGCFELYFLINWTISIEWKNSSNRYCSQFADHHTLYTTYLLTHSFTHLPRCKHKYTHTYRSFVINGKYLLLYSIVNISWMHHVVDRWLYPVFYIDHSFVSNIPLSSLSHVTQFIQ